jgi:hypothetical protein
MTMLANQSPKEDPKNNNNNDSNNDGYNHHDYIDPDL